MQQFKNKFPCPRVMVTGEILSDVMQLQHTHLPLTLIHIIHMKYSFANEPHFIAWIWNSFTFNCLLILSDYDSAGWHWKHANQMFVVFIKIIFPRDPGVGTLHQWQHWVLVQVWWWFLAFTAVLGSVPAIPCHGASTVWLNTEIWESLEARLVS